MGKEIFSEQGQNFQSDDRFVFERRVGDGSDEKGRRKRERKFLSLSEREREEERRKERRKKGEQKHGKKEKKLCSRRKRIPFFASRLINADPTSERETSLESERFVLSHSLLSL